MELQLKPYTKNQYSLGGFLVKGTDVQKWYAVIQKMGLQLNELDVYALPGETPNSVWGCFVRCSKAKSNSEYEFCQKVGNNLYIPENSRIHPFLSLNEMDEVFKSPHLFHPNVGLVTLEDPLKPQDFVVTSEREAVKVIAPEDGVYIPFKINVISVNPKEKDDPLSLFEKEFNEKKGKPIDQPLSVGEKAKLKIYEALLKKNKSSDKEGEVEPSALLKGLEKMASMLSGKDSNFSEKMMMDLKDLEKRNQKEVDKLMNLMKENPEEGLKYAFPLDHDNSMRGFNSTPGAFMLSKLWSSLSIFGQMGGSSGGLGVTIDLGEDYGRLENQYIKTAEKLEKEGKFDKAAFIYLKLLRNHFAAATCLERGKLYKEAATIYLKHLSNKAKAAECYEKGHMYSQSIEIYKELENHEKVGDLYIRLNQKNEALKYYGLQLDRELDSYKYVRASKLCKEKMDDFVRGQNILKKGWDENMDAYNCLIYYLADIQDEKILLNELNALGNNTVDMTNISNYLKVLKHTYTNQLMGNEEIKELAYSFASDFARKDPKLVTHLKSFNNNNQEFDKDSLRYRLRK